MNEEIKKLYKVLSEKGYYTKSFDDFNKQWEDDSYKKKVYNAVSRDGLYTKDYNSFTSKYSVASEVPVKKKEPTVSQSGQPKEKSSSATSVKKTGKPSVGSGKEPNSYQYKDLKVYDIDGVWHTKGKNNAYTPIPEQSQKAVTQVVKRIKDYETKKSIKESEKTLDIVNKALGQNGKQSNAPGVRKDQPSGTTSGVLDPMSEMSTKVSSKVKAITEVGLDANESQLKKVEDKYNAIAVQSKLKEKGYDVDVDGDLNSEKTIKAISKERLKDNIYARRDWLTEAHASDVDRVMNQEVNQNNIDDVVDYYNSKFNSQGYIFSSIGTLSGRGRRTLSVKYEPSPGIVLSEKDFDVLEFSNEDLKLYMKESMLTNKQRQFLLGTENEYYSDVDRIKYNMDLLKIVSDSPNKFSKDFKEDVITMVDSSKALVKMYEDISLYQESLNSKASKLDNLQKEYERTKSEVVRENILKLTQEILIQDIEKNKMVQSLKKAEGAITKISGKALEESIKDGNVLGYLSGKFALGLTSVPKMATSLAMEIMPGVLGPEYMMPTNQYNELKAKGLSDYEITDLASKELKRNILSDVEKGIVNVASLGTTTKEHLDYYDYNDITKAAGFLAESIGTSFSAGGNSTLQKIAFFAMSYNAMEEQMRGEEFDRLTEIEKKAISVPYGIAIGALEKFGFDIMKSGGKAGPLSKIVNNVIARSLTNLPKNATVEAIEMEINKEVSKMIAVGTLRIVNGALSEGFVEGTQQMAEISEKYIVNKVLGKDKETGFDYFKDVPDIYGSWDGFFQALDIAKEDAYYGALGGLLFSGAQVSRKTLSDAIYEPKRDEDFSVYSKSILDDNLRELIKNNVITKLSNGEISKDDAAAELKSIDEVHAVLSKIDNNLSIRDQRNSFNLLLERGKLEAEIKGKDENLVARQKERISEINNTLQNISKNAVQEQATSEVPVQPEASVGEEVVEGKPKTEPEVVTEEGKVEEVTPILSSTINVSDDKGRKGLVPISELEDFIGEDRIGSAETAQSRGKIDKLKEDISKNGFKEPIILIYDKFSNGGEASIIEGNHRIIAAKELGIKEIPVTFEKGTIRTDEARVSEGMFPLNRKVVGKLNDTYGVKGSDLGLTVRQPIDTDYILKEEVKQSTVSVHNETGGSSISQKGENLFGKPGFAVSVHPDRSMIIEGKEVTDEQINEFKEKNKDLLEDKDNYVGTWYDEKSNKTYVDISTRKDTLEEATKLAKDANQKAIFDLESGTEIDTGGTGTVSTTTEITIDNAEDFRSKAKEMDIAEGGQRATKAMQAAKNVLRALPGVKIHLHTDTDSYRNGVAKAQGVAREQIDVSETQGESAGSFVNGEIHIDLSNPMANARTVFHEAFHYAMTKVAPKSGDFRKMANGLKKALSGKHNDMVKQIEEFEAMYTDEQGFVDEDRAEEFLSELSGYISENAVNLDTNTLQKIANVINKIAQKVIGRPVLSEAATRQEIVDFMNTLSKGMRRGEAVDIVSRVDNNQAFENEYIQTNGTVLNTPSRRKSITVNTVVSESDVIDPATLEGKPLEVVYYDNFTSSPYTLTNRVSGSTISRKGEGGPGYSYRPEIKEAGIIAAFTNVTKGLNLIQGIRSRNAIAGESAVVGVALQNKETGHLGNLTTNRDFYSPVDGEIARAVKDGVISNDDAVSMLKEAVDTYATTSKGSNPKSSLGFTSNDFNSLEDFFKKMESISFERRGTFNNWAIPSKSDLAITKSTKPFVKAWLKSGIPTLSDYYSSTTEAYTTNAVAHDIVKYLDPDLNKVGVDSTVVISDAERARAAEMGVEIIEVDSKLMHTSYPVVLFGKNIGVPSTFHSVRSMSEEWNEPNPFFKAGRRGDKSKPVRIPKVEATERKSLTKQSVKEQLSATNGSGISNVVGRKKRMSAPVPGNKLFNEPLKEATDIAKEYSKNSGIEYVGVDKITKLDESLSKRIASEYDKMKDDPKNPEVKAAYEAMINETIAQYDEIVKNGYVVEINNEEPYSSSQDMIEDLRNNKRMKIFSTESGFGEESITDEQRENNPLLSDSGYKDVNGLPLLANDIFRFVHDFFGHAKLGNSFGPIGEENAWRVHSVMYSPLARRAMTSETRGQNSWVNFSGVNDKAFKLRDKARELRKEGKIEEANELVGKVYEEMKFADQKVGLMPEWTADEGMPRVKKQLSGKPTKQSAINDAFDKYELSIQRGNSIEKARESAIADLQKNDWYKDTDDTQREESVRELRKKFGQKEKKSATAQKITGKPKPKTVTVNEATALKDQIRLEARAAREAKGDLKKKQRMLIVAVNSLKKQGILTTNQAVALAKKITLTNVDNPVMVERMIDYAGKVFERADYQQKLTEANKLNKAIKAKLKSNSLQASVIAVAKEFTKINPSFVNDIEAYIENAQKVIDAVKPSRTTRDRSVDFKTAMNFEEVGAYTEVAMSEVEEYKKNELLAINKDLEEQGIIDSKMSYADMLEVVRSINEDPDNEKKLDEQKKAAILTYVGKAMDIYRPIVKSMLNGKDAFTGENVTLTEKQKELAEALINIDVTKIGVRESIAVVEAVDNFVTNGITDGVEALVRQYRGNSNATQVKGKGLKTRSTGLGFVGSLWADHMMSLPVLGDWIFQGTKRAQYVFDKMGLTDFINGVSNATKKWMGYTDEYTKEFKKQKPNGKRFDDAENIYERGLYAFLKRTVVGNDAAKAKELQRRIKLVKDSVDVLREMGGDKEQKMADIYDTLIKKFGLDDKNISIEDIESRVDGINKDAVNWWVNTWAENYSELSDVSQNVYNTILDKDLNYTTDKFSSLNVESKAVEDAIDSMGGGFASQLNYEYDKKTGVLMPSQKTSSMAEGRYVNLNFDSNNSTALKSALIDINTAGATKQMKGFFKSKDWNSIISNKGDRDLFRKRVDNYILSSRNKRVASDDRYLGAAEQGLRFWASTGATRALGSISQPIKQTIPVLMNVAINTGTNFTIITSREQHKWIDELGMPISNRGIESMQAFEDADKTFESYVGQGKIEQGIKFMNNINSKWLKLVLAKPDVFAARSSFVAFYKQSLKSQGLSTDIDFSDPSSANKEALSYAQHMVDRQQNVSDANLMGELFTSNQPLKRIFKNVLFPFMSFAINQKSRMTTDFRIAFSGDVSNSEKITAIRSLLGLGVEMTAFHGISFAIKYHVLRAIADLVGEALGMEGEDDEDKLREDRIRAMGYTIGSAAKDVLSPHPVLDEYIVGGADYVLESLQSGYLEEEAEKALKAKNAYNIDNGEDEIVGEKADAFIKNYVESHREYKALQYKDENFGGVYSITVSKFNELRKSYKLANDGEYEIEGFGGENIKKYIDKNGQEKMKQVLPYYTAWAILGIPGEAGTVFRKTENAIKRNHSLTEKQYKAESEVLKEFNKKKLNEVESYLVRKMKGTKSQSASERVIEELKWIEERGGLTNEKQMKKYIDIYEKDGSVSYSDMLDIKKIGE